MFLTRPLIVIIDDDTDDIEILSDSLIALDMECKYFDSGDQALLFFENNQAFGSLSSLVLLDFNMPRFNGLEILSQIKSNPVTRDIPVIIYSTTLTDRLQKQMKELGAFACYIKPWNYTDLKLHARVFAQLARNFSRQAEQSKYAFFAV